MNQKDHPFLPVDFRIPEILESEYFRIRMLTVNDVVKDYEAVMTSIDRIRSVFGPDSDWPFGKIAYPGREINWKEWADFD